MTILVTGGAGFIGTHLTKRLLDEGHIVLAVDNFCSNYDPELKRRNVANFKNQPGYYLFEGDIRESHFLHLLFGTYPVDAVIHLAGLAGVRPSLQKPAAYFDTNVTGTVTLLQTMQDFKVDKMVFASSSSVYGERNETPFRESDLIEGLASPYAISKRTGEMVIQNAHQLYGLNAYCLRFFTVYGPNQRPDMAISSFIRRLFAGERIQLFGTGQSVRDYTYVNDIVAGIVRAVERVSGFEIINLGSGRPIALIDLVRHLEYFTGRKARIEYRPDQLGDVSRTFADLSKAAQLLGYQPRVLLEEGLQRMVNGFQAEQTFLLEEK
ncbi:GDP-mannose 4,6-dehydratase [Larkinella knui]|uniref:NAD-dependent epimerase/dehydratase family protein n=1 Tax=Larkinella knui TaxID=2025310 RepID=A0A3P1CMF9_9BACT|nr:NAD-dependent epimerase/dehydratase family protein [Larkinella knui]RRB14104.1 NAD-dependent epimerase/dehydratase family protein [Larkinella knui]